jgi:hypothetical protein
MIKRYFFIRLTDVEKARMVFLMNNYFDRFVEYIYYTLSPNKRELYKSLSDSLRSKLVAKGNTASASLNVLNTIVPSGATIIGGIITFCSIDYTSDQKWPSIAGGTFSLLGSLYGFIYGMYQWRIAVQMPTYNEKHIRLIALYYTLNSGVTDTGDSIAQSIVHLFDENYNHEKTLSQNALIKEGGRR